MYGLDSRRYSRQFMTEVIELYRTFPCLWRSSKEECNDRYTKEAAWLQLLNKFREVDSDITREGVIKKFNSMRTSWRKEAKKVRFYQDRNSKDPGTEQYYPKLWYFDLLSFIDDQDPLGEGTSILSGALQATIDDSEVTVMGTSDLVKAEDLSPDFADSGSPQFYGEYVHGNLQAAMRIGPPFSLEEAKRQKIDQPCTPDSAAVAQSESSGRQPNPAEDCYDHFGRYVASMLRTIGAPDAIMLQQEITVMITNRMCSTVQERPPTS